MNLKTYLPHKRIATSKLFIYSLVALLVLDLTNLLYLYLEGLKNIISSAAFQNSIKVAFSLQGLMVDQLMLQDILNIYYTTLAQMSFIFVFMNLFFYFFTYKHKKWAFQYSKALALLGCIFTVATIYQDFTNPWTALHVLEAFLYGYIYYGFLKLFPRKWEKQSSQTETVPT